MNTKEQIQKLMGDAATFRLNAKDPKLADQERSQYREKAIACEAQIIELGNELPEDGEEDRDYNDDPTDPDIDQDFDEEEEAFNREAGY